MSTSFYDLKAARPGQQTYDFDQLRGKVVLVVNVASQWCVRRLTDRSNLHTYPVLRGRLAG